MFSFQHSKGSPPQPPKQLIFPKSKRRYLSTGWSTYMQYRYMVLASFVCMCLDSQKQKREAKYQLVHFGTHPLGSVVLILYLVAVCCPMLYGRFWHPKPTPEYFPVFFFCSHYVGKDYLSPALDFILLFVCVALCVGSTSPILSPESVQVESVPLPKILWHFCDSRIFSH